MRFFDVSFEEFYITCIIVKVIQLHFSLCYLLLKLFYSLFQLIFSMNCVVVHLKTSFLNFLFQLLILKIQLLHNFAISLSWIQSITANCLRSAYKFAMGLRSPYGRFFLRWGRRPHLSWKFIRVILVLHFGYLQQCFLKPDLRIYRCRTCITRRQTLSYNFFAGSGPCTSIWRFAWSRHRNTWRFIHNTLCFIIWFRYIFVIWDFCLSALNSVTHLNMF